MNRTQGGSFRPFIEHTRIYHRFHDAMLGLEKPETGAFRLAADTFRDILAHAVETFEVYRQLVVGDTLTVEGFQFSGEFFVIGSRAPLAPEADNGAVLVLEGIPLGEALRKYKAESVGMGERVVPTLHLVIRPETVISYYR